MPGDATESGWAFVASTDGSARLLGAISELDPDETYARGDLADVSGVPQKTLYLDGAIDELASLGVFERTRAEETGETRYRVDRTSDVVAAAAQFDDAVRAVRTDADDADGEERTGESERTA